MNNNVFLSRGLEEEIDKIYSHEIKVKRVRKEMSGLGHLYLENITLLPPKISELGIRIPVRQNLTKITVKKDSRNWQFELRLDTQYPFGHPQLHSLDKQNTFIGQARDLLGLLLDNRSWGPSIMLSTFIQELPLLLEKIEKTPLTVLGRYWQGQQYDKDELVEKGLKIVKVRENTWRLMMKSTADKILAISSNVILKLQQVDPANNNRLKLETAIFMKDIREAKTNLPKNEFTIKIARNNQQQMLYFTSQQIQSLLLLVNPIQMIQRRVKTAEDSKQYNEQLVKDYGVLIQYYSVRNPQQSNQFVLKMKEAIKKSYEDK